MVRPYRVRFDDATADETVRSAVCLAWMADCTWQHSISLGFGREEYTQQGFFWLVRAIQLEILRPIPPNAGVLVSTQVVGCRRIAGRRANEIYDHVGQLLARGEVDWVTTNRRGMPTHLPPGFAELAMGEARSFEFLKVGLPETPPDASEQRFRVRRRDLDVLDHVNNSVYLDFFEDALEEAGQADLLTVIPRRYELEFVAAAAHGDYVRDMTWPCDGGWAYRLCRDDGTEIVRARLQLMPTGTARPPAERVRPAVQ
jgi:acyl-CoA thioesterase FadM